MKQFIYLAFSTGALVGMIGMSCPALAQDLTRHDVTQAATGMKFSQRGKIESVDVKRGEIVLNGRSYRLPPDARVYGPSGGLVSHEALRKGIFVEFNTAARGTSFVIGEIGLIQAN